MDNFSCGLVFRQKIAENVYHFDLITTNVVRGVEFVVGYIIVNVAKNELTYNCKVKGYEQIMKENVSAAFELAERIQKLE